MRGVVVLPGGPPGVELAGDLPEPPESEGEVLVEAVAVGVCGTDREIAAGEFGTAPPGRERLVIGHESLGRVLSDSSGTFAPGELVAGIVRRPDPVPCPNCAAGEWDMCRNGRYTECGITGRDGFGRERWRVEAGFAVRLDPALARVGFLLEPASVVAKVWEHVDRVGARARWRPRIALVTGAGPIGLLAALLAAQRGLDVHVLDRERGGAKPALVADLGGTYHVSEVDDLDLVPDVVVECTAAAEVLLGAVGRVGRNGVVALTGVPRGAGAAALDVAALSRAMVLGNRAVFGSVNANRRHWQQAAEALGAADPDWLERLVSRRVPLRSYADAYLPRDGEVKVVLQFGD